MAAPSTVLESLVEGFGLVLQQTPLAVIAVPPSEDIVPPVVAVEAVILVAGVVDTTSSFAGSSFLQLDVREKITKVTIAV